MKLLCYLAIALLHVSISTSAQQLLCERDLASTAPASLRPAALLRLEADTLRILTDYNPSGPDYLQVRLRRVNTVQCDTLPTRTTAFAVNGRSSPLSSVATTRRGRVMIAQTRQQGIGTFDSSRIVLQFLNRDGSLRWQRALQSRAIHEGISGILEAPENGFFLERVDS